MAKPAENSKSQSTAEELESIFSSTRPACRNKRAWRHRRAAAQKKVVTGKEDEVRRFLPFAGMTRIRFKGLPRQCAESQPSTGLPQEQLASLKRGAGLVNERHGVFHDGWLGLA